MVFLSPLLTLHDMSIAKSVGSVEIHDPFLIDVVANDSNHNTHEHQIPLEETPFFG